MEIFTSIAFILNNITRLASQTDPDLKFQHDPGLDYEDTITGYRRMKSSLDLASQSTFPLLAYNRSALNPSSKIGRRGRPSVNGVKGRYDSDNSTYERFDIVPGSVNFRFKYFSSRPEHVERFELLYASLNLLSNIRKFEIELTDDQGSLGSFPYSLEWENLADSFEYSRSENLYMAVEGQSTIDGPFFIAKTEFTNIIKEVNVRIYGMQHEPLLAHSSIDQSGITHLDV